MFCSTATRSGRNKTSWSGQSPDTPEQGRIHPRTRLTRRSQGPFDDTGQALAWSWLVNATETHSGGFTPGRYTSMLTGENITVRILNILLMGKIYLKYVSRRSLSGEIFKSDSPLLFR